LQDDFTVESVIDDAVFVKWFASETCHCGCARTVDRVVETELLELMLIANSIEEHRMPYRATLYDASWMTTDADYPLQVRARNYLNRGL
jgi:hypothetical protein